MKQAEVFIDLILAAMTDAAVERKLCQLKTSIQPKGHARPSLVRIIIVPENMDMEWPQGLGASKNEGVTQ